MARKSSIKTLPPEILAEINELLTEEKATIDEIVAHLDYLRHPRSRSAVGRYKQQIDKVAEKLRRSREISQALVKEIGPAVAEGKTGRLLVEVLQSIVFDHLMHKAESDTPGTDMESQDFFFLAKALKEMAAAHKIDVDRELKIREEFAKEAAKTAGAAAKKAGISEAARRRIEEEILGLVR